MSSQEAIENQRSLELGFTEMTRKSFPKDSISGVMSSKSGNGRMGSSIAATPNAFSGEDESSSKLSSPVVESNNCDLLRVDLKLGRFADHSDVQNIDSALATPILSSAESSMPAKRPRAVDSCSQALFCKVHGCKKDLSSSKDYHKRHKVCEVHSKTSKVIVSGIEQRFCQQCSRFHLLAEFDDGKRSCRKRLACHNERRRKPRVGNHSGRAERLFQSYNGSRFQGTTLTTSSFNCPDMLPSSLMDLQKCENSEWRRQVKIEDRAELAEHGPQSVIPIRNGNLHSKSIFSSYGLEKQSPFHGSGLNTEKGSDFNENINSYPHDLSGSNSFSHCFFQNTSTGTENFTFFNSASTIERLSDVSDSGLALSLLSSQSRNSSSHLSGTPMAHPLIIPGSHSHNSVSPVSEKFPSTTSQALTSGVSNRLHSAGMISAEENYLGLRLISDDSDTVNFGIANGVFQGPEFLNTEDCFSRGNGPTIDLLQLPSQLQRVEHQSHSMQ